jgi:hypothetical protein
MNLGVSFSFPTHAEKQEFEKLAKSRGLSLSQFVRWCVYKYRRDREANTEGARARRAAGARARTIPRQPGINA